MNIFSQNRMPSAVVSSVLIGFLLPAISMIGAISVNNPAGNIIDWDDGSGWSTGLEPTASDDVLINQQKTVNVTTTGNQALSAQVANTIGNWNASYLNVKNGGGLTLGSLTLAAADPAADAGIVNVETGGSLTNNGALTINAAGVLNITGGTYTDNRNGIRTAVSGAGTVNITGGSFIANSTTATDRARIQSDVVVNGGALTSNARFQLYNTLTIVGSNSTVSAVALQQGTVTATVNWIFDAAGVSSMDFSGFANTDTFTINIDGSAYTGGPSTFNLITSANISTVFNTDNLTVTGFGDEGIGWNWLTETDAGGGDFLAIQVVPEPATAALFLGFGALGLVCLRRRLNR